MNKPKQEENSISWDLSVMVNCALAYPSPQSPLCQLAIEAGVDKNKLFVHAFTDGRDTDPKKRGEGMWAIWMHS